MQGRDLLDRQMRPYRCAHVLPGNQPGTLHAGGLAGSGEPLGANRLGTQPSGFGKGTQTRSP